MLSKKMKTLLSLVMCALMAYVPTFASANGGMISTTSVIADLDRAQQKQKIANYLSQNEVQQVLINNGLSQQEVESRLASLSQQELNQLSGQIDQARAGGDILITILVVVLIIFLIQRL